jgi:FAD/FMN-containing dehydrogenase/Fe-S oxidoreductase
MNSSERASIARDLEGILGPEGVLSTPTDRKAYSYDAGIYREDPILAVLPKNAEEVARVVLWAGSRGIPMTPRSGGTNITGAAIGEGIILGLSRLNRWNFQNAGDGSVYVEPGMILKELNDRLALVDRFFAPDPSSGLACQIGGMIGTNAAGAHALKYGAMKENILSLEMIGSDGNLYRLAPQPLLANGQPDPASLPPGFQGVLDHLAEWAPVLREKRRNVSKNSSGYNLFDLAQKLYFDPERVFDPARLIVGAEGTLGVVTRAELLVRPLPSRRVTVLAYFLDLDDLGSAVARINELGPSALEMMDRRTLDLVGRERFGIPPSADSMLLIEFDSEPMEDLVEGTKKILGKIRLADSPGISFDPGEQLRMWQARHALFPTLYRYDGIRRPLNFADDVAVPVHRLVELLRFLREFFSGMDVPVAVYGHIGNGNAHINPLMNLAEPGSMERLLHISQEIHRTVIDRFEGVPCGEHGEGRVRAEFLPSVYGPEVYQMFCDTKRSFDPQGIFNPGVKISRKSFLEGIDIERVVKSCATCGKCNTVCPSFDVTRNEAMGPRGWFQMLTDPSVSPEVPESVLGGCLNCKSCRTICPAGVDVSAVVLSARAERGGDPVSRFFSEQLLKTRRTSRIVEFLGMTQNFWDRPALRRPIEAITRKLFRVVSENARIPAGLKLPRLRSKTLRSSFHDWTEEGGRKGDVAYFHGCAANYLDDGVGEAMIRILSRGKGQVVLPRQTCSGTPIETYGHRDLTRSCARENLESLSRYEKIVTGCASCTLALKDLPHQFPDGSTEHKKALDLSKRVVHIAKWMMADDASDLRGEMAQNLNRKGGILPVSYHSSCHLRAAGVVSEPVELLKEIFGEAFRPMMDSDRCAGGSGTYLLKNPEISEAVFQRKREAVAQSGAKTVTTGCPACQIKLADGLPGDVSARHMAVLLADLLS